jgi:glycosyltransferase involved in cell wall biosynthesis
VDDGSSDGSSEKIDQLATANKELSGIHFTKNNGQTAAFLAGFKKAAGLYIVTLDADLQVDPGDLHRLLPYLDNYDMVIGVRSNRNDGLKKKFSSGSFIYLRNL